MKESKHWPKQSDGRVAWPAAASHGKFDVVAGPVCLTKGPPSCMDPDSLKVLVATQKEIDKMQGALERELQELQEEGESVADETRDGGGTEGSSATAEEISRVLLNATGDQQAKQALASVAWKQSGLKMQHGGEAVFTDSLLTAEQDKEKVSSDRWKRFIIGVLRSRGGFLKPNHDTTRGTVVVIQGIFGSSRGRHLYAVGRVLRMCEANTEAFSVELKQQGSEQTFKCELLYPVGEPTPAGAQVFKPSGFSLPWVRAQHVKLRVDCLPVPRTHNGYLSVDVITQCNKENWKMIDPVTCDGLVGQGVWQPGDVQETDVGDNDEAPDQCYMCLSGWHDDQSGKLVQCKLPAKSCKRYFHQTCHDPVIQGDEIEGWQCGVCSGADKYICYKCGGEFTSKSNNNELLACDYCDRWVHQKCHTPPLASLPRSKFKCLECKEQAQVKARLKAAATAACKKKQEAAEAQRRARAEAAQMANGVARKTRSGRLSQPVMTNNPDLRYLEPRRTRNSRMSW